MNTYPDAGSPVFLMWNIVNMSIKGSKVKLYFVEGDRK